MIGIGTADESIVVSSLICRTRIEGSLLRLRRDATQPETTSCQ